MPPQVVCPTFRDYLNQSHDRLSLTALGFSEFVDANGHKFAVYPEEPMVIVIRAYEPGTSLAWLEPILLTYEAVQKQAGDTRPLLVSLSCQTNP